MPEYQSPGVYVEEIETAAKAIEGVSTSTVGFLGVAERGPLAPTLVTSFSDYVRMFGGFNAPSFLAHSVRGFFENGGQRCFVARVAASNGAVSLADFTGDPNAPPDQRTGLLALEEIAEISILCCPDQRYPGIPSGQIAAALIEQCERLRYRFAVLQAGDGSESVDDVQPVQATKYGAFYYPWAVVADPVTSQPINIPAVGHVAGVYARIDIDRGVWKAPEGEVIRGAIGLQINMSDGEQDIRAERGVNAL